REPLEERQGEARFSPYESCAPGHGESLHARCGGSPFVRPGRRTRVDSRSPKRCHRYARVWGGAKRFSTRPRPRGSASIVLARAGTIVLRAAPAPTVTMASLMLHRSSPGIE